MNTPRKYVKALGPGLITGASDDDPSGIATYAQAGAQVRFSLLWTALLTFPLMSAVQEMCDRTALATGEGLGELIKKRFGKLSRSFIIVLLVTLIIANALNISADAVAIGSGMALLHAGSAAIWALLSGVVITALLILGSFAVISRIFKFLCATLLSYLVVLVVANIGWKEVAANTFIPHITFSKTYLALLVAVFGTTISPYLFFWESAHRIEALKEDPEGGNKALALNRRSRVKSRDKQRETRVDVISGMFLSNIVMFAIIVVTGQLLGGKGHSISSAAQAAEALKPVAGKYASTLFALGFIGSGFLAIPVLAGSGAAPIAGLLGKEWGFSRSVRQAPLFYGLVGVGTVTGTFLTLLHVNPIQLLVIVAVINGLAAAPFLFIVILVARDKKIMGKQRNGKLSNILVWFTFVIMALAAIALIGSYL